MAPPGASRVKFLASGTAYGATYGATRSRIVSERCAGLRPIYARRLGWWRGPSGELSSDYHNS